MPEPDAPATNDDPAAPLRGLRIDVVGSSRELFGSDRSAVRLARLLTVSGAQARLVLPGHRPELGLTAHATAQGVETVTAQVAIATSRGLENGRALLRRAWPGGPPDVAILNTTAVVLPPVRTRVLLTVREWMQPSSVPHRGLALVQGMRADGVVGISTGVNVQWRRTAVRSPAPRRIWNWMADDWVTPTTPPADRPRDILFLGRFNAWKGQDILADAYDDAFAALPADRRPALTFLGAEGAGSPFAGLADDLRERAATRPWDVRPVVPDPRSLLEESKLVVVPSLRPEPFGNVLLEGVAAGCKVLAFPGGGPDDLAEVFPGILRVVDRSRGALSRALAEWWARDGHGQDDVQLASSRATLRDHFTARRAEREWVAAVRDLV